MINHSKPYLTSDDISCIQQALESGNIAKGEKVKSFEHEIAKYVKASSAFATGSGTSALTLALMALGVKGNDEVILPTYVCKNVMDAVNNSGAIPVLCDIGNEWNMTAGNVKAKISFKTKAIVAVNIYGIRADIKGIKELGFAVIEDCCQSLGAKSEGNAFGNVSEITMYSFQATKLLTTGEGGALATNDAAIAARIKELIVNNAIASPMSDIQAALGLSQLNKYEIMLKTRKKIALRYCNEIKAARARLPHSLLDKSIFFRFPILIDDLDFEKTQHDFHAKGVHVRHGVDSLLHRNNGMSDNDYPNAVRAFNNTLSIPIYPALKESEQDQIIEEANKILS